MNSAPTESIADRAPHPFSADRPISVASEDLLDRTRFTESLANSIKGWREKDSLVVGLHGPWGCGKTSLKNLVLDALDANSKFAPDVIEFNPWQWSSQSQIAEGFFREVEISLGRGRAPDDRERAAKWRAYASYLNFGAHVLESLRNALTLLAGSASVVFGLSTIIGHPALKGAGVILAIICLLMVALFKWGGETADKIASTLLARDEVRAKGLAETKAELKQLMLKREYPLIVILDDLDRLSAEEIALLFQLVKTNADFPNMIYLLVFQRDIVERALEASTAGAQVTSGREYLEKIIQVGFDIPRVEQTRINRILDQRLTQIYAGIEFDSNRLTELYFDGLQHFFRTLRDVKRYLSMLDFHMGQFRIGDSFEVNPVDLTAIEVLRIFEPNVYSQLSGLKHELTRFRDHEGDERRKEAKAAIDGLVQKAKEDNREHVLEIIKELFPMIQQFYGGYGYSGGFEENWFRDRRICHPDVFDRYFLLRIPEGDVSQADIDRLLACTNDRDKLLAELRALKQRGLLSVMLDRFEAYKQKVPLTHATQFISAFIDFADEIPDELGGMMSLSAVQHASRIVYWFLKQEPSQQKRGDLLTEAARNSHGVFLTVAEAQSNDRDDKEGKKEKNPDAYLIDEENAEILKQISVEKIKSASVSGDLLNSPQLQYLLYRWKAWGGPDAPSEWLKGVVNTDTGLRKILVAFMSRSTSQTIGSRVANVHWRFDLSGLEEFIDPIDFQKRVEELSQDSISDTEMRAIHALHKVIKRKADGKPYDGYRTWLDDDDE